MYLKQFLILLSLATILNACKKDKPEVVSSKIQNNTPLEVRVDDTEKIDTVFKSNDMVILKTKKLTDTLLIFHSDLEKKKFEVPVENLKLTKELDFSHYEFKKTYITTIKEGIQQEGVNFAGSFCFVSWGCGSPCKLSAVVDMKTGIVYNGLPSAIGYKFKKESEIIIVNPSYQRNYYSKHSTSPPPSEYIWTGEKFIKKETSS